ncbi:MAG: pentapeptide repeat-containing protein [Planctomycetota bacterium]
MAEQHDVFLSYSRDDGSAYASLLAHRLETYGFSVFTDDDLLVGDYNAAFERAIEGARLAVLLLTQSASSSRWVEHEVAKALRRNTHVVPVVLHAQAKNSPVFSIVSDRACIDATHMHPNEVAERVALEAIEIGLPLRRFAAQRRRLSIMWYLSVLFMVLAVGTTIASMQVHLHSASPITDSRAQILRRAASFRETGGGREQSLDGVVLPDVDLRRLDFSNARIRGAVLVRTDLTGSILISSDLSDSSLTSGNLREVFALNSDFSHANMALSDCSDADFSNANFTNADLRLASLENTTLRNAKLQGADLSTAHIENTVFENAEFDRHTQFPDGFDPIAAGLVRVDGSE